MSFDRRGPKVEIKRGSWEERLAAMLAEERARTPERAGHVALIIEGRPEAAALAELILGHLGAATVHRIEAQPGLLLLTEELAALQAVEETSPLLCVCVAGSACRKDGIKAAWKLSPVLKDRLWIFIHDVTPKAGLPPTVGAHVRRYLDVIEGLAFSEGPGPR
ncbi:MAG: hypothetical protein ACYTFT_02405 [Planctomycetota bacterium]|jgi:hypothetical protein